MQRIDQFAVNVELELIPGGVTGPDWSGVFVAGEPGKFQLNQPPATEDAVHDLQLARIAGGGSKQPIAKPFGFFGVTVVEQGIERECGVAYPAKSIVPVANASQFFGKRGGRRGHDTARGSGSQ